MLTSLTSAIRQLRVVGYLEGISFVLLLFVAMPLKYGFDLPIFVRVVGLVHGILFLLYLLALSRVTWQCNWRPKRIAGAVLAALVPFGVFVLDPHLRREELALTRS